MRMIVVLAVAFLALSLHAADSPIAGAKQLVLVVSPDWDATNATLRRYELQHGSWKQTGGDVPVVIGRTGLAWGRGVNAETGAGPVKREGDGKSPAGVFRIGDAFGFDAAPSWIHLPYIQLQEGTQCVDDVASALYNRVVLPAPTTRPDWSSSEKMRAIDVYRFGAVVMHNDPPQKGGGSCIFLHIVDSKGKPTAGCTSMPVESLKQLLGWLDPKAQPLIVQLPQSEYGRLRMSWHLP